MNKSLVIFAALACTGSSEVFAQKADSLKNEKLQEIIVRGVRVDKNAPFAITNINQKDLQGFSTTGQELPFLFARTPGALAWGENGLGTGTTYMRLRGAGGSRINVTLDGVPLNSPEDQTVFWANMNSYASLLGSVQIQRGVGASTNGDGAFGGSIALGMAAPSTKANGEATFSYGSYNTARAGVKFSTGLLANHWIFDGAYHATRTDGYLHGTAGRSGSYYGGLTYLADNFKISYKNVGNFEKTGQAWNGVTAGNNDATLMGEGIRNYKDLYNHGLGRFNSLYEDIEFDKDNWVFPTTANGNYKTFRYKLRNGNYWDKTTDNFYQNHNILSGAWRINNNLSTHAALHYTYGYGYYNEFKPSTKFDKFALTFYDASGNFVKRSDFVRKKGLTQHTYGLVWNINYKDENWDFVGGLSLQQFRGNHFGYITYIANEEAERHFLANGSLQYYDSDAHKYDYSGFIKTTRHINQWFNVFADVQYRFVNYYTNGTNDKIYRDQYGDPVRDLVTGECIPQPLHIDKKYNFWNPKAGINFDKNGHHAYASVAYSSREPERNNFTDNGDKYTPKPEHVFDYELGYNYTGQNYHLGINAYYMKYDNQFVQTGEKSDIGENLTVNIKDSYRMGVEITAGWAPFKFLTLEGNAALSQNRIKNFDEQVEDWDSEQYYVTVHHDKSTLAFSPNAILNGFATFQYQNLSATWHTNFVSSQYLDNSANDLRALPCYSATDIMLQYNLKLNNKILKLKEVVFGATFNNIFNRHYASSGWVYSAVSQSSGYTTENRYYQIGFIPMSGFTAMGSVTIKF